MIAEDERKSFSFTWILENISCYWREKFGVIKSPTFGVSEQKQFKGHLNFCPRGFKNDKYMDIYLNREDESSDKIDCELTVLTKNGLELKSMMQKNGDRIVCFNDFLELKEVFNVNRSSYLPDNKLTVRCKIWKSEGELTRDLQWFVRTRICIRREVFLWNIPNFSKLKSEERHTYHIKSVLDKSELMSFKLILKSSCASEDSMSILLVSENRKSIYFEFCLTLLNGLEKLMKGIKRDFFFTEIERQKIMSLPFSQKDVTNENGCLPNDVLSFRCECTFSTGAIFEEIETIVQDCEGSEPGKEKNPLSTSKRVLSENLRSLFQDNILFDVKLKTKNETFLAHKSILSARSPVFKAMFENDMKEKITDSVSIEDLDSNTMRRMLQYAYTAEIGGLQWESACELYRAADKYEILTLKDECSAFLKDNISLGNACKTLIIADTHQDGDLKSFVQDFIFEHDIIATSENWKVLMETQVKLALDTMYLHIQRKQSGKKCHSIKTIMDTNIIDTSVTLNPSRPSKFTDCFPDNIKNEFPSCYPVTSSNSGMSSISKNNFKPLGFTSEFNFVVSATSMRKKRNARKKWTSTSNVRDQATTPTSTFTAQRTLSLSNFGALLTPPTSILGARTTPKLNLDTPATSSMFNFGIPTSSVFTFGTPATTSGTPGTSSRS